MNGVKLWPTTNYAKPLPPKFRRMPGRPSISRRKDACEGGSRSRTNNFGHDEVGRTGRQMTCKNCWEVGHNSRGCKNQKKDAPTKQKNPVGRPRGSGLSRGSRYSGSGRGSIDKTSKERVWSTSTDCGK